MKFSFSWLGDFIEAADFLKDPKALAEALTKAGLEAEGMEDPGASLRARFKNVVVAEIQSVENHPQADRLTICRTMARDPVSQKAKSYRIVCGAKNHRAGDKAALALPGAVLPGPLAVKSRKIRGEASEGMLASAKELGLEDPPGAKQAEGGILILPPEAEAGQSFFDYLRSASHPGLEDVILDLNVTPNRADCLSHFGLAREISCLFNIPLSERGRQPKANPGLSVLSDIKAAVLEPEACPRYCGRLIQNVRVADSPPWLKKRLKSIGLKPINNVVDAANYVLWDQGQPLHAFDRDKIQSVSVARSVKGESFKALDGKTLVMTGGELTIRDGAGAIALAGVIGGAESAVSPETKNIFLESAFFRPEEVRRAARRFGLQTDSSYRFSRGTDPEAALSALNFAAALIQELAGGEASEDVYDFYPDPPKAPLISISLDDLEERLGLSAQPERFEDWMRRLKCRINRAPKSSSAAEAMAFQVTPPPFRTDLSIKEDLIEEFARLNGFDSIPEAPPARLHQPKELDPEFASTQKLEAILRERGWNQAINYSFSSPDFYQDFLSDQNVQKALGEELAAEPLRAESPPSEKPQPGRRGKAKSLRPFCLKNPISRELSLMKPLLAPDLLKNALHNLRHNCKWGRMFEIAPVFFEAAPGKGSAAAAEDKSYMQTPRLGLVLWGKPLDIWDGGAGSLLRVKSFIEALLQRLGIGGFFWDSPPAAEPSFIHPRQFLALKAQGRPIGFAGSAHPRILLKHKASADLALAELSLKNLWSCAPKKLKARPLPSQPFAEKDLCFVIPKNVPVEEAKKEMLAALGAACAEIEIFDLYEKEGARSVSFRLFLRPPPGKTWTEAGLQECQAKVISRLKSRLSLSLKT